MKLLANVPLNFLKVAISTDSAFKLHYNIWLIDPGNSLFLKVALSDIKLITATSPIIYNYIYTMYFPISLLLIINVPLQTKSNKNKAGDPYRY